MPGRPFFTLRKRRKFRNFSAPCRLSYDYYIDVRDNSDATEDGCTPGTATEWEARLFSRVFCFQGHFYSRSLPGMTQGSCAPAVSHSFQAGSDIMATI